MPTHHLPIIATSALLACALSSSNAFSSTLRTTATSFIRKPATAASRTFDTRLYISSWGPGGNPALKEKDPELENPEKKIQSYLKAPEPVAARPNLDGTVLVSGLVRSKERTDQTIFDLLNHEDAAFEFDKIVAFVDDMKFAKKRLLSRSARYTGLLDKLDFVEASAPGANPTPEQLKGVKSWVACIHNGDIDAVKSIGSIVKDAPDLENVAVLLDDSALVSSTQVKLATEQLTRDNLAYTIILVGKLGEHAEGSMPYRLGDMTTPEGSLPMNATISRDESLRMVTEALALESGKNRALSIQEVYHVNVTEAKLIKGLREAGYTRPQEVDHMLTKGPEAYLKAIEEWKTKQPAADAEPDWMIEAQAKLDEKYGRAREEVAKKTELAKQKEIEGTAREWAKREYFRKCMSNPGEMTMSEEEYIESVWERAMFEGELKYKEVHGGIADKEGEIAEFEKKMEKKEQAMLEKARKELSDVLTTEDEEDDDDDDNNNE